MLLLARHFDQQQHFQVVQKDLIAFMRSGGIATPENYKRRMSGHDIHLMLKSKIEALSYVGGINVFDAEDDRSTHRPPGRRRPSADRAFFRTFKSSPQSPEMVEPVYSRMTGAWTTVIAGAKHLTGARKGEFLGVIGRGIEPVNFEKFFATVGLGPGATFAMHHRLYAARPLPDHRGR